VTSSVSSLHVHPAVWARVSRPKHRNAFATTRDVLRLPYAVSAIHPQNARSRRSLNVGRPSRRTDGSVRYDVGSLRVAAHDRVAAQLQLGVNRMPRS